MMGGSNEDEALHAARLSAILAQSTPTHEALTSGEAIWHVLGVYRSYGSMCQPSLSTMNKGTSGSHPVARIYTYTHVDAMALWQGAACSSVYCMACMSAVQCDCCPDKAWLRCCPYNQLEGCDMRAAP
jgi:hypothetical protein